MNNSNNLPWQYERTTHQRPCNPCTSAGREKLQRTADDERKRLCAAQMISWRSHTHVLTVEESRGRGLMGSLNVPLLPRSRRVPLTMVRNGVRAIRAEGITIRWPERLPIAERCVACGIDVRSWPTERERRKQRSSRSQSNESTMNDGRRRMRVRRYAALNY